MSARLPGCLALWLLLSLVAYGVAAAPATQLQDTIISGRLSLFYADGLPGSGIDPTRAHAFVVKPATAGEPRTAFQIANWEQLRRRGLPPGCSSGAQVTITGARVLPRQARSPVVQVTAASVVVESPAPRHMFGTGSGSAGQVAASAVVGTDLPVLVVRPRLPEGCRPANMPRVGTADAAQWRALLPQVNQLQSSCSGGKLSYAEPVVSEDYLDIPCTAPASDTYTCGAGENCCDYRAFLFWELDTLEQLQAQWSIDPSTFRHIIIDAPIQPQCNLLAYGNLFDNAVMYHAGVQVPQYYSFQSETNIWVVVHEMGHNYGLQHAATLQLDRKGNPPPLNWVFTANEKDDTNLMGYNYRFACYDFPQSVWLGLATAQEFSPSNLPAGQVVDIELQPSWGAGSQGAVFSTGRPTQRDWRIWAGYILSNDSPFPQTLPDPIYNSAVVLHLSSSLYALKPDSQDSGFSYRVRVLQSGDVYRWASTSLTFKFVGTSTDKQTAVLQVCRATPEAKCSLEPTLPPAGGQVRLWLQGPDGQLDWCLKACTSSDCALPSPQFPSSLTNVYFTRPCPKDASTAWTSALHSSGFARWVHDATGKCLTIKQGKSYIENYAGDGSFEDKYRLVLDACQSKDLDFRSNGQLFLANKEAGTPGAERYKLVSARYFYPKTRDGGTYYPLCVEGCQYAGSRCTEFLPTPTKTTNNTIAVAGNCRYTFKFPGWELRTGLQLLAPMAV